MECNLPVASARGSVFIICCALCLIVIDSADSALILNKFATKNTYEASNDSSSGSDSQQNNLENCEPVQVIVVARHGIRYPGLDDLEAGLRIVGEFRRRGASAAVVDGLEAVLKRDLPVVKSKELSETGARELREMGFRFASRYLPLYSAAESEILFVSSTSSRAVDSCSNFRKGFVDDHRLNVSVDVMKNDHLLRFFDFCPRYVKGVRKNKTALAEHYKFQEMETGKINVNIARRLNVSELQLTAGELYSLYKIAACEVGIVNTHHWLDVLSESDLDILEYGEDLEEYWKLGSGYPINYQQSCPLLVDIFEHMHKALKGKESKRGVFYFGHAETVVPLMTLLRMFTEGDALRADNFNKQRNRTFKTSIIAPFSTNVAFVLHKCSSATRHGSSHGYTVQLLFKEQTKRLRHLCSYEPCTYKELRKHLSEFIDHCDFDKRCSLTSDFQNSSAASQLAVIIVTAAFILMKFVSIN